VHATEPVLHTPDWHARRTAALENEGGRYR
jgi:hypothetical protein